MESAEKEANACAGADVPLGELEALEEELIGSVPSRSIIQEINEQIIAAEAATFSHSADKDDEFSAWAEQPDTGALLDDISSVLSALDDQRARKPVTKGSSFSFPSKVLRTDSRAKITIGQRSRVSVEEALKSSLLELAKELGEELGQDDVQKMLERRLEEWKEEEVEIGVSEESATQDRDREEIERSAEQHNPDIVVVDVLDTPLGDRHTLHENLDEFLANFHRSVVDEVAQWKTSEVVHSPPPTPQGELELRKRVRMLEEEDYNTALKGSLRSEPSHADERLRAKTALEAYMGGQSPRPSRSKMLQRKSIRSIDNQAEKDWLATLRKEWEAEASKQDEDERKVRSKRRATKGVLRRKSLNPLRSQGVKANSTERLQRYAMKPDKRPPGSAARAPEVETQIINDPQKGVVKIFVFKSMEAKPLPNILSSEGEDLGGGGNKSSEWISELRDAWNAELHGMGDQKQKRIYNKANDTTMSKGERKKLNKKLAKQVKQSEKGKQAFQKKKRELLKDIEKNKASIQVGFQGCGAAIRSLRLKEKQLREDTKTIVTKARATYDVQLVNCTIKLQQSKYLSLLTKMTVEHYKSLVLKNAVTDMEAMYQKISELTSVEEFPVFVPFNADEVMSLRDIVQLRDALKGFKKKTKRLKKDVARLRAASQGPDGRSERLKALVAKTVQTNSSLNYFPWRIADQLVFNQCIMSHQYIEGLKIEKLREAVEEMMDDIPPEDVVEFMEDFVDELTETFAMDEKDVGDLRLYTSRAIFPRIFDRCFNHQASLNVADEAVYRENRAKILKFRPRQLDPILAQYYDDREEVPFESPIDVLENLIYYQCPTDMMMVIHNTMKCIHWAVSSFCTEGNELGADDLFPLLLYVTIQAEIPLIHHHLRFMENFAFGDERMTQLGYCVTMFGAAVSHVRMLTDADVAAMEERDPYATAQCKEEITTTEESVSDGDTKSDCGAAVVMGQRSSVSSSDSADSPRPVRSSWSATSVPLEDEDED